MSSNSNIYVGKTDLGSIFEPIGTGTTQTTNIYILKNGSYVDIGTLYYPFNGPSSQKNPANSTNIFI